MKALLLLSIPLLLSAQGSDPMQVVSVRACVESALAHNPAVRMIEARYAAAAARSDEAGAAMLPQLRFTGRLVHMSDIDAPKITLPIGGLQPFSLFDILDHQYSARLSLTQPLFTGSRLSGAQDAARLGAESTVQEAERDRADLALQVEQAYWGWVQALEAQHVLEKSRQQLLEHERVVQRLSDQGLATASDVLNVQVRRSDVEVRLIDAQTNAAVAVMALNTLMGNPISTPLTPAEHALVPSDTSTPTGDLFSLALAARPDLKALQLRKAMSEASVTASKASWYPQVALAANYEYARPNSRIIPPQDRFDGTWDVGLTVQWTIWDWSTTGAQAAQAEAAVRQADAGLEQLTSVVALEVAQTARRVSDAGARVKAAELGVKAAEEARRIVGAKFDRGAGTTTEVLDADVNLLQARLALTRAAADLRLDGARLRRALGERP